MDLERIVKKIFLTVGLDVRKVYGAPIRDSLREAYQHLAKLDYRPNLIIDVGVATGTFELYETFPDARYFLVEPLQEFEPAIQSILKKIQGDYLIAAAGDQNGEMEINVHPYHLAGSTLMKQEAGAQADGEPRKIRVIQLDDALEQRSLPQPSLIKIDVQGAELKVLDGCQKCLKHADVVVLEVSLFKLMKGIPEIYDVMHYMKTRGFVAYDIIHGINRPLDNALAQVDILFVREDGMFRKDHAFCSIEQMDRVY